MSTTTKQEVAYTIPHASITPNEIRRLDDMHEGYKEYLDGRLSFAPLEESNPKAILELGTGSGAWAIQAARQFPNAEVVAVDLSPIPRALPPNMKFKVINLMEPFPFEPRSFDVIHARLVFMHIPKPDDVIRRVVELLKPGGWLILEDLYFKLTEESDMGIGPAIKKFSEVYDTIMESRGVENKEPAYDKSLDASGEFSEINARTIVFPISEKSDDAKRNKLGAAYKTSLSRMALNLADQGVPGFTHELAKGYGEELHDRHRNITSTVVFTWARKRV